jgi:N-acetylmuramoyl-L-alanine amidase
MPSMLVEQAFMSNPEDEAKMLDPQFRATMMKAVVTGIEDWLRAQRDALAQQSSSGQK